MRVKGCIWGGWRGEGGVVLEATHPCLGLLEEEQVEGAAPNWKLPTTAVWFLMDHDGAMNAMLCYGSNIATGDWSAEATAAGVKESDA